MTTPPAHLLDPFLFANVVCPYVHPPLLSDGYLHGERTGSRVVPPVG